MEESPRLLAVDRWVALVNLLILSTWLPLAPHHPLARWMSAMHLAALALPWLLDRANRPFSRPVAILRDIYPLLWVAAFWSEFGLRHDLMAVPVNDAVVAGWDLALFGAHLNWTWVAAMPWVPLSETFQAAYFSYYLMLAALPLALLAARDAAGRHEVVLRVALTYLGCFLIYSYFPVVGPRENWPVAQGDLTTGFFYQVNLAIRVAGDSLGTAFPSSHTAGAVTFAWVAWRTAPAAVAWVVTVLAGLIAAATVYTQNHFAIDTLAGIVVAVALQSLVAPALLGARPRRTTGLVPTTLTEPA